MAPIINRDLLLKELNKLAANQTDGNITSGIHAAIYLVEKAPEVRAREAEVKKKLCAVADPDPVKPVAHCPAPERQQISLWEVMEWK